MQINNNQLGKIMSIEKNIELVKQLRDGRIKSLLRAIDLMDFPAACDNPFAISTVKLEFLKRDLNELLRSPLDLAHYSASIRQIKDSDNDRTECGRLIEQEIKRLIDKYESEKTQE